MTREELRKFFENKILEYEAEENGNKNRSK